MTRGAVRSRDAARSGGTPRSSERGRGPAGAYLASTFGSGGAPGDGLCTSSAPWSAGFESSMRALAAVAGRAVQTYAGAVFASCCRGFRFQCPPPFRLAWTQLGPTCAGSSIWDVAADTMRLAGNALQRRLGPDCLPSGPPADRRGARSAAGVPAASVPIGRRCACGGRVSGAALDRLAPLYKGLAARGRP